MSPEQTAVLAELATTASLRRIDLMQRTRLSRAQVAAALDVLCAAGMVRPFANRSWYSLRKPSICPPAEALACSNTLADDTHALEQRPCGAGRSTVAHT